LWTGYPDLHFVLDDMVAEGDKVAIRTSFAGTYTHENTRVKWLALIHYCVVADFGAL
jgi:SnoaL-like polyketide cyclase